MTVEEMEALGRRAATIRALEERLAAAEDNLDLLRVAAEQRNKNWQVNESWAPSLLLAKGDGVRPDVKIKIRLPFQVVQQQLVDAVTTARREFILAGGSLASRRPRS